MERATKVSVKEFVLTADHPSSYSLPRNALKLSGPLVAAIAAFCLKLPLDQQNVAILACLLIFVLLVCFRRKRSDAASEIVIVTVFPAGVQLSRVKASSNRPVRPPLFLPRDVILDVIVNEVILAHRVVSVVLFRIWKRDGTSRKDTPSIATLLKEGRIQLVPAFPGVEMSFRECHMMRRELSAALGLM